MTRNFIPKNRGIVVLKRHLPMITIPAMIGIVIVLLWRFIIFPLDWNFTNLFDPVLFIALPLACLIYVLFATIAISSVFQQYKEVSKSVIKGDIETFLLYRDEELPFMMHILIGTPSIVILFFTLTFNYENNITLAVMVIFSVVFLMAITWKIATELDNFEKSVWFKEKIPKDWFETDINEYFKKKQEKK